MSAKEQPPYKVVLSPTAADALRAIGSKSDLRAVGHMLQLLDTVPYIGRTYDPLYEAARPATPVTVVYAGHYGIYYDIDEQDMRVEVAFIEDQRRDPLGRFHEAGPDS